VSVAIAFACLEVVLDPRSDGRLVRKHFIVAFFAVAMAALDFCDWRGSGGNPDPVVEIRLLATEILPWRIFFISCLDLRCMDPRC